LTHATITSSAQAVVDRFVQASGGRSAWEQTRTLHEKGTLSAFGLKGSVESWRQAPNRSATTVAIGPLTIRSWSSAGSSWRTDPGGKVLKLDGKDLDEANASDWFENQRWLEPDQGGGDITTAADVTDSLGTFTVLVIKPPVGQERQLEFDRKTGLLTRALLKHDQLHLIITVSDYQPANGWMVPFRNLQEVRESPANNSVTQLEQADVPPSLPEETFVPPAASGAAVTWLKTPGTARLGFDYHARHVWLRASVNGGPPADFVYDTGASITVIDSDYAAKIGLKSAGAMRAQGGASSGNASFSTLDRLRIEASDGDGVELHDVKAVVVSVNPALAPFFWRDCAGIVGFDVIGQFVNRVDFDARQLVFYDPHTFAYAGNGTALPMTLAGNTPVVKISVDGQYEGSARVDVGSGSMLDLHTPFVKQHALVAKSTKNVAEMGSGIGGTFESRIARMRSIEIGPYKVEDPLVGLSTVDRGALASQDYAGNIGNGLLERFTLTLDYEHRQIWLEPGARYAERPRFSQLGADLLKYGDAVKAAQVLPGSPAARAGLKDGDVVTAVDGQPTGKLDADQLDRLFEDGPPGSTVSITVSRNGKQKTLSMKLEEIL
jgi:hypothetical protein